MQIYVCYHFQRPNELITNLFIIIIILNMKYLRMWIQCFRDALHDPTMKTK